MKNVHLLKPWFCIFLCCIFCNAVQAQDTAKAIKDLQNGSAMYNQRRYAAAITYFTESVKQVPTAFGYLFLGASYYNIRNYDQAKINVTFALNLNPPLTPKRQQDATDILRKISSIENIPAPPPVAQETSDQGASSDPITSIPEAGITAPSEKENPLVERTRSYHVIALRESIQCSQENFTVKSTYQCDLENNGASDNADFWWNTTNYTGILTPRNGAKFFLMWNCPNCYDTLTKQALMDYNNRELMSTYNIMQLKPGYLIAYVTRNNLYGIIRIENILYDGQDPSLLISFRTYK